jgi:hypothetical protein
METMLWPSDRRIWHKVQGESKEREITVNYRKDTLGTRQNFRAEKTFLKLEVSFLGAILFDQRQELGKHNEIHICT